MRAAIALVRALVLGAPLLALTSCAAVWGFDPLSGAQENDDASVGNGDAAADGASDAGSNADGACPSCADTSAAPSLQCQTTNGTCVCAVNSPGNGAACSPSSLGVDPATVLCCADPSYPTSGSCMCNWLGCTTSNGSCICGGSTGTPGGSCPAQSWTCCVQESAPGCVCSSLACSSGYTPLGNACGVTDMKCGGIQRKVASCNK